MKKIILTLAVLLGTFSAQASTLFIENYCTQARARILHMMVVGPGGECHFDISTTPNYFVIDPMDSFTITDGVMGNRQFPFLDVFPFSGNVYFSNPAMSLPLPPTTDNGFPATTRYQLYSIRFLLDNAWAEGMSTDLTSDTGSYTGVFNSLPGNPPYTVDYARLGSIHYFSFND